jgi:hypothetical protein
MSLTRALAIAAASRRSITCAAERGEDSRISACSSARCWLRWALLAKRASVATSGRSSTASQKASIRARSAGPASPCRHRRP